jgi:hypothetical protein
MGCTATEHRCIALPLAFFAAMAAIEQTDGLTAAAIAQCKARHNPPRALCEAPHANCIRDEREDGE